MCSTRFLARFPSCWRITTACRERADEKREWGRKTVFATGAHAQTLDYWTINHGPSACLHNRQRLRYYDKRFNSADRLIVGHVVGVDPGEPPSGGGEDADPGTPPSSHYQFTLNGVTYDGWIEDELSESEPITVRYNSSDPNFNHAQDDHRTFTQKERFNLLLLFIVLGALVYCIRNYDSRHWEMR
jgi:hypothetical protein